VDVFHVEVVRCDGIGNGVLGQTLRLLDRISTISTAQYSEHTVS
jgi:isocitrate/isopropylmalate dehydrogenase